MIKRRRLVALVSVIALLVIGFVAIITGVFVTRTSYGQEELRRLIQGQLTSAIKGKVYLGPVSGGFLTGIQIDSFAIRDADNDSLLLSTGRITASYDPRDLIDKRLLLRNVDVQHPVMYIRQHPSGRWNFKEIFRGYEKKNNLPKSPGRNFGDYIVIDSAHVHDATFVLQMPWTPDDSLRGAKLDSAVNYTLARRDKEIRRVVDEGKRGFARTWRWTGLSAVLSRIRLADPDSDKLGRLFVFDTVHAVESDPPFRFRNIRGTLRNLGDSIWVDVAHFDLPQSSGAGGGKIVWGSDLPVRYDITVRSDSVALNDVAWVYPTLPTTGGGKVTLHIGNEKDNLHVIDYKLTNMDVKSTGSHLIGDMTFVVGGPVLGVKDVKMSGQPFDFDLLRALNGKPFPVDWRGQLYGSVRARGGPLTRFYVDESEVVFRDAHVPGASSRVGGKGELNILQPALTSFRHFDVTAASVDLRSIEYLYPNFPRLGGTISGTATLDSSWLDVRFANADITHRDGPGEPTHLTGNGRVTWGPKYMTYDIDAQAQPISLGMLARSYPKLPLTGLVNGPVRARGTIADLQLTTALQGPAGALSFDGRIDIDPPGYAIRGTGQAGGLAVHQLLDSARLHTAVRPLTLTGRYDVALAGDSLPDLEGSAAIDLTRADVDGLRVFPSTARLRFASGRLLVDTLRLETTAATVLAHGALGLPHGASDSLRVQLVVDSLGGFRRYLAARTARDGALADSLEGQVTVNGAAYGRLDSLDVRGTVVGNGILFGTTRGRLVGGRFAIRNLLDNPVGRASLRFDTLTVAGILLDSVQADLDMAGRSRAAFAISGQSDNGPTARVVGSAASFGGALGAASAVTQVTVDSLGLTIGESRWRLRGTTHIARDSAGVSLDSLVLVNGGSRVALRGTAPQHAPIALQFAADSIGLADLGVLAQLPAPLGGFATMHGVVTGTRARPDVRLDARLTKLTYGGMQVERAAATGAYHDRSFDAAVDLFRNNVPALRATMVVPMELTLFSAQRLDAPIHGSVRADSADLSVIETLSSSLQRSSGRLTANLDYSFTPTHKSVNGLIAVRNGQVTAQNLGITLRSINGSMRFDGRSDSVQVDLAAASGTAPGARIALRGSVNYAKWDEPRFNLALFAHNFHAIERRTIASLDVSTAQDSLRLTGPMDAAALTGTVRVERGEVYLPERDLLRKQVIDLSGAGIFDIIDSTDYRTRTIVPDAPSRLVKNLRLDDVKVVLGDEVWLRSREANIKLGGSLDVRSAEKQSTVLTEQQGSKRYDAAPKYGLALAGTLTADRGSYTLDLSPAPVQREFGVERGGTITFFGAADFNPEVNITATHDVKRMGQPDLVIQVHLSGFLYPNPTIDLKSTNEPYLFTSDLVSYLVTGQPTYALNSGELGVVQQVSNVVGPTLSAVAAAGLRGAGFNIFDQLQIESGAAPTFATGQNGQTNFKDYIFGTRLGAEKQISNNLFFSFSAGLCSLNRENNIANNQNALNGFVDALSGKLEYRFNPHLSLQAGTDPSTSNLYCRSNYSLGNVIQTPRQWGLSLLRTWHF